ncbi:MAG: outer membrane protein assembly factor BamE domain-containing protein [Thiobacillus sp.]
MRHFLISTLLLSLVAGCSSVNIGPHRIDVQQGNALDQESIARLKPGLSRSQVRFLLGTPLVVDPFRTDRWDYVYLYYKAGKLAEQKRITLIFEGDTLARIDGDLPTAETVVSPASTVETPAMQPVGEARPAPVASAAQASAPPTSVVSPLSRSQKLPTQVGPRPVGELSLQADTDVAKIQSDAMPVFPVTGSAAAVSDAAVLESLNEWAEAWARRDAAAHFLAYEDSFVPQGGGSRADWEKRKRRVIGAAKSIEIKVESPSVERDEEGTAVVTFNQHYRSDSYSDAVVKQLRMVEREGRWLIVEEKVLSTLPGSRP